MASIWDVITGDAEFKNPFAGDFQRGLNVLRQTITNEGVLPAAKQLYGAAGDVAKEGFGVNDPQRTSQAVQNLMTSGANALPGDSTEAQLLRSYAPAVGQGTATVGGALGDALNPAGFLGAKAVQAGLGAIGPLARETAGAGRMAPGRLERAILGTPTAPTVPPPAVSPVYSAKFNAGLMSQGRHVSQLPPQNVNWNALQPTEAEVELAKSYLRPMGISP